MLKKIKNIFCLLSSFIFIILTTSFYFSEQNVIETNKSRSLYSAEFSAGVENLPLLKNDTNNIIYYRDDVQIYKKNKKSYKFWDLIGK